MNLFITASMLYDYLEQCPHRVTLDLYGDQSNRDSESEFLRLLWEKGTLYEKEVIQNLNIPFTDLSIVPIEDRERLTMESMSRGDDLIYSGRICFKNLLGEPDLLRKEGGNYIAGDIKSGSGFEGISDLSDGRPKPHFAVQLALYTDILEKLEISAGRSAFIWDIHGQEVLYNFDIPQGPRTPDTLWELYKQCLDSVENIIQKKEATLPAYASQCKQCHWYSSCLKYLIAQDDLTLIPGLGRSKRDKMFNQVRSVAELVESDISAMIRGNKTIFSGIGPGTLKKYKDRACLLKDTDGKPYLTQTIEIPDSDIELFFDIETDPMRDICYLHGFVERRDKDNNTEKYIPFFAENPTPEEEKRVLTEAWEYVQSCQPCTIYYYSKYERTWWRNLQKKCPEVISEEEIEEMFHPSSAIDLYQDVITKFTEWPTHDHSIKTLASYLGFKWRDTNPSGAESVVWYHRWIESGDPTIRQRILEYNEDDCIATRVLLDGLCGLHVQG
ncbi:TM0106 family RecB-like putative nuclease [Candidatus Latescibacterota bacterium]